MVGAYGQVHALCSAYRFIKAGHDGGASCSYAKYGGLRRVHQRDKLIDAEHTQVAEGESPVRHVAGSQPPFTCRDG